MRTRPVLALALSTALAACGDDTPPPMPDLATAPDLAPATGGARDVGKPCTGDSGTQGTCPATMTCVSDDVFFTGGFCTFDCSSTNCPAGTSCEQIDGVGNWCAPPCNGDGDCRSPDYVCADDGSCLPFSIATGEVKPGTRDGGACVAPARAPSADGGILGGNVMVSAPHAGATEAETELAVDPATHRVVVAYIDDDEPFGIGVAASQDDGASFAKAYLIPTDGTADTAREQSDPVVAVDGKGNFYVALLGFDFTGNGQDAMNYQVVVTRSTNGGVTFDGMFRVTAPTEVSGIDAIDKPWIAASPVDGALVVTWSRDTGAGSVDIRMARSTDAGMTWSPAVTVSETAKRPHADRNLAQVAFAPDGTAAIAWVEVLDDAFGSLLNGVWLARLDASGAPVGANVRVTRTPDMPAFEDPSLAFGPRGELYVGFVSGTAHGDWDVRVTQSLDGGQSFAPSVKVNDDPSCATHFHHQLVVDGKGDVHAVWYDNRYGVGNVFHAASPAGMPLQFGGNDFVDTASFDFTTRRDLSNWLGDYLGLAAVGSELYASWTDPRGTNESHVYFARGTLP